MSQNKTIVPGVDFDNLNKEGAADSFYESLYSRTSANDNHTFIGSGELINLQAESIPSTPVSNSQKHIISENCRTLKIKERVIVGVLFSISKGLLGEIIPIYLGKNIIGKNENCDVVLSENTVSAEHAIIHTRKNENGIEATITDFNSMYGTIVNDADARYDTLPIHENDVITIGQHYRFIIKLFETEKYDLYEDAEFEDSSEAHSSTAFTTSSNAQDNPGADFYSPSSRNNDSSRTVIH